MDRLKRKIAAAWWAFQDYPPDIYFVVQNVEPLGWLRLGEYGSYLDAMEAFGGTDVTRVMTEAEWNRRTLATMRSVEPWVAVNLLTKQVVRLQGMLQDYLWTEIVGPTGQNGGHDEATR